VFAAQGREDLVADQIAAEGKEQVHARPADLSPEAKGATVADEQQIMVHEHEHDSQRAQGIEAVQAGRMGRTGHGIGKEKQRWRRSCHGAPCHGHIFTNAPRESR
jgi:hypothetical protein